MTQPPNGSPGPPDVFSAVAPHPCMVGLAIAQNPSGTDQIQMSIGHAAGVTIVYLQPENAEQIARDLTKAAAQARRGGLYLPPQGPFGPN